MALGEGDKLNRIEELKSKLFSKNFQTKIEHRESFTDLKTPPVQESWGAGVRTAENFGRQFFTKTSFFKKFFYFSLGVFVLAVGYASYMFFVKGNTVSNENIDISILGNAFTAGGEELTLQISITHRNTSSPGLGGLVVEDP